MTTVIDTPAEINGVPTAKLFATIAKLSDNGDLAAFRFSARNEWVEGTASASTIHEWYGAGAAVFDMLVNPTSVDVTRRASARADV